MRYTTELLKLVGEIDTENKDIVDIINTHIGNVEYSHDIGKDYEGIVVAEIVEKKEHPNANKLCIYIIFTGKGERIQVVAGDKTLEIGDKVVYIKPGSTVPISLYEKEPIVIKNAQLRGIESNGMLGSENELNIGPNHEKVMRLPADATPGTPFAEYYSLIDYAINVENKALTNRGDLFGLVGMARELTAITGGKFKSPEWYKNQRKSLSAERNCLHLEVINDAEALCHRYTAVAMDSITNGESPIWLKSALIRLDIKPTNSIVDITNYVSTLLGQPLHAFDYDKVIHYDPAPNNKVVINIRMAKENEKVLGLDNKIHELNDRIMVIADSRNPIAIAGIIGGKDTSVDENTERIILESANFDKNSIRKTSMELGLSTDAATKFKHSLDTELCIPSLLKAVALIKEIAGGVVASEIIDINIEPYEERIITINSEKLNKRIGTNLDKSAIQKFLEALEYEIKSKEGNYITVIVPSWRRDVNIEEDIYEDIVRIYGYNNIRIELPKKEIRSLEKNRIFGLKKDVRDILSSLGANEILSYSFTSDSNFKKCNLNPNSAFIIKNALSPELSLMRVSLLQSILPKCKDNIERGYSEFGLFEINIPHIKGYLGEDSLPKEDWHLSSVLIKDNAKENGSPYYWGKSYFEKILGKNNYDYQLISNSLEQNLPDDIKVILPMFDANVSAICYLEDTPIGVVGELKENIKRDYKLFDYSCVLDINLSRVLEIGIDKERYSEVPIYPTFSIDFSFESADNINCNRMIDELKRIVNNKDNWARVECLDIYKDPKTKGIKRTTLRVIASRYDRTANEKDIKEILDRVSKEFKELFKAKII